MTRRRLRRALHLLRRLDHTSLRAAWWAARALRALRRDLPVGGLEVTVAPPPPLPARAIVGVTGLAVFARATCLERSLLVQRWLSEHGTEPEVLVGVANLAGEGFRAHAWVAGFDADPDEYSVLAKVPAPPPQRGHVAPVGDDGYS